MLRYFLAIIPPENIQKEIKNLQLYFAEKYNSKAALSSPPHITLIPPFEIEEAKLIDLEIALKIYSNYESNFPVTINNFGQFNQRVIFANVDLSHELADSRANLAFTLSMGNLIAPAVYDFHPHVTLAFKDLSLNNFVLAWREFEYKKINFDFMVDKVSLLNYKEKQWIVQEEFKF